MDSTAMKRVAARSAALCVFGGVVLAACGGKSGEPKIAFIRSFA
jgi:hypothetical protein